MIRRLTENRPRLRVAFHLAVVLVPVATASALAAAFFTGAGDSVLSMLLASMAGSICFAAGYFTLAEIVYRFSSNSPEIEIGDLNVDIKTLEDEVTELNSEVELCEREIADRLWEIEQERQTVGGKKQKIVELRMRVDAMRRRRDALKKSQ